MRSVELFSGCGGLALGLSNAGFHHDLMVEWNADAVETVLHNQKRGLDHIHDWPITRADVRKVDWRDFRGGLILVAGGPPCQPFSIGGKHKAHNDDRDMWPQAVRAVAETRPQAFIFENVRGLLREAFREYLNWITTSLEHPDMARRTGESHLAHLKRLREVEAGPEYRVLVFKANAADFGAPQTRHRVIIAGVRADLGVDLSPPARTHSRERLLWDQWVTGEYWKRHGLARPNDSNIARLNRPTVHKLRDRETPPPGRPWITVRDALLGLGDPSGTDNHVFQDGARVYVGHTGSPLDMPAKALKAGVHGVPGGENIMVRDDGSVRYFTVREAARLQGLPDDYLFPRSWTESMRQLGNAVPVQLSENIGRWMRSLLTNTPAKVQRAA